MAHTDKQKIIIQLHKHGAVKFGEFTLKSGIVSPVYIDLRVLISYPKVMKQIAQAYAELIEQENIEFDRIAGIPYAALPYASAVSLLMEKPWIFTRKEVKEYGTKKLIEGEYRSGERVVVIDDLITTGTSKFESLGPFQAEGLEVKDFIVLIDREQGGSEVLRQKGYGLHAVMGMREVLSTLFVEHLIGQDTFISTLNFIEQSRHNMDRSWARAEESVAELALQVKEKPDMIVGVVRGGIVPARLLSKTLQVDDVQCLGVFKSGNSRAVTTDILQKIKGKRVLAVDDLLESGESLRVVQHYLESKGAEVETAALYKRSNTIFKPTYCLNVSDQLIDFPWE